MVGILNQMGFIQRRALDKKTDMRGEEKQREVNPEN